MLPQDILFRSMMFDCVRTAQRIYTDTSSLLGYFLSFAGGIREHSGVFGFERKSVLERKRRKHMSNAPLMPKATAVLARRNTSLTFEQIANFCKLHPLEVRASADGEVAAGIKT